MVNFARWCRCHPPAVLVVASTIALLVALPASARLGRSSHFDNSAPYTHGGCPGTTSNRIDPLNVVFWDWGTYDRVFSQIQSHAGWNDDGGSSQTFVDHSTCYAMHGQRASSGIASTRFHIRIRGQHSDPSLGWTATGDAHHEDLVITCGHAVDSNGPSGSGFDQGRNTLRTYFSNAGHSISTNNFWGNTQNFKQCDGDLAGSNGYTTFIQLHQVNH